MDAAACSGGHDNAATPPQETAVTLLRSLDRSSDLPEKPKRPGKWPPHTSCICRRLSAGSPLPRAGGRGTRSDRLSLRSRSCTGRRRQFELHRRQLARQGRGVHRRAGHTGRTFSFIVVPRRAGRLRRSGLRVPPTICRSRHTQAGICFPCRPPCDRIGRAMRVPSLPPSAQTVYHSAPLHVPAPAGGRRRRSQSSANSGRMCQGCSRQPPLYLSARRNAWLARKTARVRIAAL